MQLAPQFLLSGLSPPISTNKSLTVAAEKDGDGLTSSFLARTCDKKNAASMPAKAPKIDQNTHLELQELLPLRGLQQHSQQLRPQGPR